MQYSSPLFHQDFVKQLEGADCNKDSNLNAK